MSGCTCITRALEFCPIAVRRATKPSGYVSTAARDTIASTYSTNEAFVWSALGLEKKQVSPECTVLGDLCTVGKQGGSTRAEQCVCAVCRILPFNDGCGQRGAVNRVPGFGKGPRPYFVNPASSAKFSWSPFVFRNRSPDSPCATRSMTPQFGGYECGLTNPRNSSDRKGSTSAVGECTRAAWFFRCHSLTRASNPGRALIVKEKCQC